MSTAEENKRMILITVDSPRQGPIKTFLSNAVLLTSQTQQSHHLVGSADQTLNGMAVYPVITKALLGRNTVPSAEPKVFKDGTAVPPNVTELSQGKTETLPDDTNSNSS